MKKWRLARLEIVNISIRLLQQNYGSGSEGQGVKCAIVVADIAAMEPGNSFDYGRLGKERGFWTGTLGKW